jgi:hypothetical protein
MPKQEKPEKNKRSHMYTLPPHIISVANAVVQKKDKDAEAYRNILELLKDTASPVPTQKMFRTYVVKKRIEQFGSLKNWKASVIKDEKDDAELLEIEKGLNISEVDAEQGRENRKRYIRLLNLRCAVLLRLQRSELDPRVEKQITDNLQQANKIQNDLDRLDAIEAGIGMDGKIFTQFIVKFLLEFMPMAKEAFKKTLGKGDADDFIEILDRDREKIDLNKLLIEANTEVSPPKGAKNGK